MSFPNTIAGKYGWEKDETTDQRHPLGTTMTFVDGRRYKYVEAGASNIEEGLLVASEAVVGNHDEDLVVATGASAGDTTVTVTLGGTEATENLYAEGYLFFNLESPSNAYFYKIKSHPLIASSGNGVITIDEEDGFEEAIVAGTDKAGLIKSPYKDLVVAPAAVAGRFVGVTVRDLTAGSYGWVQTAGMSVAKIDGTPAVGTLVGASSTHAGQLLAVGADTTPAIARLQGKAGVDNEYHTVFLMNLD